MLNYLYFPRNLPACRQAGRTDRGRCGYSSDNNLLLLVINTLAVLEITYIKIKKCINYQTFLTATET